MSRLAVLIAVVILAASCSSGSDASSNGTTVGPATTGVSTTLTQESTTTSTTEPARCGGEVCLRTDMEALAGDSTAGRDNATPGSEAARDYLIGVLSPVSEGLNDSATGNEAFVQSYPDGNNVLAVVRGTDLADEYLMVGAHYDHLGSDCPTANSEDTICNGATDNAAGVAEVLAIADNMSENPARRSVIFALWDGEEDGLVGSSFYAENPLVPLDKTVAYINFDIQGSNLLPSLAGTSFAVASESGGDRLTEATAKAVNAGDLDVGLLSAIFGQNRSDYAILLNAKVPTVFFTDSTGPCYHTAQDDLEAVDFDKLKVQAGNSLRLARDLADGEAPEFQADAPAASFDDVRVLQEAIEKAWPDRELFSVPDLAAATTVRADLQQMVDAGADKFGEPQIASLIGDAATLVGILTHGECDGFKG